MVGSTERIRVSSVMFWFAVEGDVEVEPEQHPFPFQIHLIDIFHSFTSGGFVGGPFAHPLGVEVAGMGFIAQVSS